MAEATNTCDAGVPENRLVAVRVFSVSSPSSWPRAMKSDGAVGDHPERRATHQAGECIPGGEPSPSPSPTNVSADTTSSESCRR